MKENIGMLTAVIAIIISIIAITAAVVITPEATTIIGENEVSEFELAEDSVASNHIIDGTIAGADVGSSIIDSNHILDETILLADLHSEVLASMTGIVNIVDNSITSTAISNGSIYDRHVADDADISPSKIAGTAWTSNNDGSGSGLDADTLDTIDSTQFLRNDQSGTLDGNLTVDSILYSSTRTHYYSVSGRNFHPIGLVDFNIDGCGSFYLLEPTGEAYASVHLPDGATVTSVIGYFRDTNSDYDIDITLQKNLLDACGFSVMAYLSGNSDTEYYSVASSGVTGNPINNELYAYSLKIECDKWQSDVALKGIAIEYTISEAE